MKKIMFAFFLSLLLVFPSFAHAEETGAVPASVQVTGVTAADGGMVNYGSGSKYRVGSYYPATFKGTLKDTSGQLMANQPIQLYFEAKNQIICSNSDRYNRREWTIFTNDSSSCRCRLPYIQ